VSSQPCTPHSPTIKTVYLHSHPTSSIPAKLTRITGFWQSPTHFSTISAPILAQLAKASHLPALANLIPCITALAVAADSPEHHKSLNAALLAYMRSDEPAVRLAAVQCEMSLTEKLGEEWLSLLPEMLPFISEAQEDDDEKVEREVGRWILKIEGILGESLDSMLL